MIPKESSGNCFGCSRDQSQIPLISWAYQGKALWVCCQCIPRLIHKWEEVTQSLFSASEE